MPLDGEAMPRPKAAQLARGARRYRRRVASPKQWQAIIAAKGGPCRCCNQIPNGRVESRITFHHVVARVHGGDDCEDNMVPVCILDHDLLTRRDGPTSLVLLACLTDAEYAYMIERGGESYPERAYGIEYRR